MTQLSKVIPYAGTKISSEQTQMDIKLMLKEFGVYAARFTDTPEAIRGVECPILEFVVEVELNGVKKQLGFRIKTPLLVQRKRRYGRHGEMISTPAINQSMRLLHWWLKGRLEGVRWGLESLEETLLSRVIVQLPSGQETTVGEITIPQLTKVTQQGLSLLPEFEIRPRKALTTQKETIVETQN